MKFSTVTIVVILVLIVLCCCLCFSLSVGSGLIYQNFQGEEFSWDGEWEFDTGAGGTPTSTPVVIRPTSQPTQNPMGTADPSEDGSLNEGESSDSPSQAESHILTDTLDILEAVVVPVNDLIDISQRLEGKENIPLTVEAPAQAFQVGAKDEFWLVNTDTNDNFQIDATLRYVTEHAYFWIEDGVSYDHDELEALAETFENKIYPTNREFFGSEWSPGVDDDPHLYIIYAGGLGYGLAGYYSSSDEYPPQAHEYSNAHETFVFNADNVSFSEEFTLGVLAHEFQHMIHWYRDRNESTWLNEGFSELAAFINGYDVGGFDYAYTNEPDLQLNDWPNDQDATSPHYGAAFLFVTYFLDRFGEDATQALVGHADNGMSSVDAVLAEIDAPDTLNADDVFVDWVLASYLHDENVADGRYTYHNYPDAPQPNPTENIKSCSTDTMTRDVHQYGVDYIRIVCRGDYTFHFEGSTQVSVLPADAYSGDFAFWSNKGDESDMTLTRSFDFSDHTAPLTLSYWTWYDLEEDYDYLFLEASLDGEYWQIIQTPSGVINDPSGNSYGWAYNGLSGGDGRWIQEQVDISQFAGQEVQIRFEYITDAAVNGEGFLLDDIAIPEAGYSSDLEEDSGGWDAAGFVRIQNILPQTFSLALITKGETTSVEYIPVSADNVADIPLHIGADVDEAILVVTATTRYTRQKAAYRFEIAP